MPHFLTVELSEETAARLGDLSTTTGAPVAELARAAVETRFGHRPAPPPRPHGPVLARLRRPPADRSPVPEEYGGEG